MPEAAELMYDDIVEETQQETGEVTGEEFNSQVKERTEETKSQLQDALGEAADEFTAAIDRLQRDHSSQINNLVGDDYVGDTKQYNAAGLVERDSKKKVLDKEENTAREVGDIEYRRRVGAHEDVHKNDQATSYNSQTVRALDDKTGETVEVSVVGDLTEGQAIRKSGQPDGDLVPEYITHREQEEKLAEVVGAARIDSALQSGDTEALQREIDERQREQLLKQLMNAEGLPNEQN